MTNPASVDQVTAAITDAVRRKGVAHVCRLTGASRESVVRVVAGLPVRKGTIALMRQGIANRITPSAALVKSPYQTRTTTR